MGQKTLLNGVNDVLQKAQYVSSGNPLTSLTNSSKQIFIDNAVASWNEAVDQIYSRAKMMRPNQAVEDTITLVTGKREYSLPDDMIQIRWPLHDETNGRYINKYPGSYEELRAVLIQPGNYTGQPTQGAISPIDGLLYIDNIPTASENGDVYTFFYWADAPLSRASDTFPFSDDVYRAMVPVVTEVWKHNQNNNASDPVAKINYGRAVRMLRKQPMKTTYVQRHGGRVTTHPLGRDPYVR